MTTRWQRAGGGPAWAAEPQRHISTPRIRPWLAGGAVQDGQWSLQYGASSLQLGQSTIQHAACGLGMWHVDHAIGAMAGHQQPDFFLALASLEGSCSLYHYPGELLLWPA